MTMNARLAMNDPRAHAEEESLETRARVKQFVIGNFYVADPSVLTDETSLIDSGLVDSTGMLEVVGFVESEFHIRVGDQELTPANFETIARISAFIERRLASRAPGA
jgi:acyl carrier protein